MDFLAWLEQTGFSTWLRESPSMFVFPAILVYHAIGMGFLAGANAALDLRVLGFAPGVPIAAFSKFFPVMWFGLVLNVLSGILLLLAYPTKALTNPIFYLKLVCIALGLVVTFWMRRHVVGGSEPGGRAESPPLPSTARLFAALSLVLWAAAITSGRWLAYTCNYLLARFPC